MNDRGTMVKKTLKIVMIIACIFFVSNRSYTMDKRITAYISIFKSKDILQTSKDNDLPVRRLKTLSAKLESALNRRDTSLGHIFSDSLIMMVRNYLSIDTMNLTVPLYFIGAYYSVAGKQITSLYYLQQALIRLKKFPDQKMEGRILYIMGYSNFMLGDYLKSDYYFTRSLDVQKKVYGIKSLNLIEVYIGLASVNNNIRNYEKAIEYSNSGLEIANINADSVSASDKATLYQDIGVALLHTSDYKQANRNLLKAQEIYNDYSLAKDNNYINILNNIATSYFYLGQLNRCIEFYEMGINYVMSDNSIISLNLFSNYSVVLGENKMAGRGVKILASALEKSKKTYKEDPRIYYLSLRNYAEYLREYKIDVLLAKQLFLLCYDYCRSHPWDINLNNDISLGYSLSLMECNNPELALDSVQSLLYRDIKADKPANPFSNPDIKVIKPDKETWNILGAKYRILKGLYNKNRDIKALESAAGTSELLITVLERIRLNIGEEESRLLLGDKYRDSYMDAIESFNLYYKLTADPVFLEKAFGYTEKSKAANLLASTREMKAIKYNVPEDLALAERSLQQQISFYEAKMSEESYSEKPDDQKIRLWSDYLLSASQKRDSLIKVFERNFPGYYALKYNTGVITTKEIPYLIGKDKNYISYVISDTSLYILVVNRKHTQLIVEDIDSSFMSTISGFRRLLSNPELSGDALNEFTLFQSSGYKLYNSLIEPVEKYLISEKLIISPDNTLAFFPFEILITENTKKDDLLYRKLPFLMNNYQISYTYSATLLAESKRTKPSLFNRLLSFAPSYNSAIYVDSLLIQRQSVKGILHDLPYARDEATYVSHLTSGKLYLNDQATESAFKAEAAKYDIIHLAMHTVLNEKDPVNSGMIFAKDDDSTGDGYLSTYEIYDIPLFAKMVVLSSCYTGAGTLFAGEGILSLARGFIFAGSRSVVMSLWEVDDRSGTDIIKSFYKYLKTGDSKSESLWKARKKYLENSDNLRSHPYFWSTLVIYGDDSPLYYKLSVKILAVLIPLLLVIAIIFYFRKRRYS